MTTTIQVSDEVWKELNIRKKKGETFEDIIRKLLKMEIKKEA
jgi:predicted CopG family antitoxin